MEFKINLEDTSQAEYAEAEAWQTAVEKVAGVVSLPWKYKATDVGQCAQAKVEAMRAFIGYLAGDGLPVYLATWLQKTVEPEAGSDIESAPKNPDVLGIPGLDEGEVIDAEVPAAGGTIPIVGIDEAGEPVTEEIDIGEDLEGEVIDAEVPAGTTEKIDAPGTVVGEPDENEKEGGLREVPETE